MSEKINLFELDIDIDALTDSAGKALRNVKDLEAGQAALKKSTKDLHKEIGEYSQMMKEAKKAGDTKTYKELQDVQNGLKDKYVSTTTALAKNSSQLKAARKEYGLGTKMIDAFAEKQRKNLTIIAQTDGSIDQLQAAISKNRAAYRSLSKAERENSEIGGKLLELIQEQDKEYKQLSKDMGVNQVEVGNYKNAIKEAFQEGDFFNKNLQGLIQRIPVVGGTLSQTTQTLSNYVKGQKAGAAATTGTSKALRIFKIALISTGIGAIAVALGTLVAAFMSTQKGIDTVTRITKPLQVIFQRLWGIIQKLGTQMVESFSSPKEAIAGLWKAIKTNIINRFTGIIDSFKFLGKTIKAALNLDFDGVKENAAKLGESVVQTITGVDDLGGKIKKAAQETKKFLSESVKIGTDLANLEKKIEERENEMLIIRAELNTAYEKQKEIAQDITKSEQERKEAAQKAVALQDELLTNEQGLMDMRIRLKEAENSLNDTSREDQKELNELIAERTKFEADAAAKRAAARGMENTINKEIEAKKTEAQKKELEQIQLFEEQKRELKNQLELENAETEQEKAELKAEQDFEKQVRELEQMQLNEEQKRELLALMETEKGKLLNAIKADFEKKALVTTQESLKKEVDVRKKNAAEVSGITKQLTGILTGLLGDSMGAKLASIAIDAGVEAGMVGITTASAQAKNLAQATAAAPPPANAALIAAATGQNVAMGVKSNASIAKILASSALKGLSTVVKAEHGAVFEIGGKPHSGGGTQFYGEDGTRFEAEKDELLFVLNRKASAALGPSLSRFNEAFGGRPLWDTSNYLADGGAVSRAIQSKVPNVKVDGHSINMNYDVLAQKLAAEIAKLPNPQVAVTDILEETQKHVEVVNGADI